MGFLSCSNLDCRSACQFAATPGQGLRSSGDGENPCVGLLESPSINGAREVSAFPAHPGLPITPPAALRERQLPGKNPESAEGQPPESSLNLPIWFDLEAKTFLYEFLAGPKDVPEPLTRLAPDHDIIHVANQSTDFEFLQKVAIKRGQVQVCEVLRGQSSDGKSSPSGCRVGRKDPVAKLQYTFSFEAATNLGGEYLLVD